MHAYRCDFVKGSVLTAKATDQEAIDLFSSLFQEMDKEGRVPEITPIAEGWVIVRVNDSGRRVPYGIFHRSDQFPERLLEQLDEHDAELVFYPDPPEELAHGSGLAKRVQGQFMQMLRGQAVQAIFEGPQGSKLH